MIEFEPLCLLERNIPLESGDVVVNPPPTRNITNGIAVIGTTEAKIICIHFDGWVEENSHILVNDWTKCGWKVLR
jgi:hypothetical protein